MTYVEQLKKKIEELDSKGVTNVHFAFEIPGASDEEYAKGALKHLEVMEGLFEARDPSELDF